MLQKLQSPCRAEFLRVSSHTNHSNTSARRANKGREGEAVVEEREREREREKRERGERESKGGREEANEGGREGGSGKWNREKRERESEIHVVDRGSMIATINTSSAGLLARVVLALCISCR